MSNDLRFVVGQFDGTENIAQFDGATALYVLHARRKLGCRNFSIIG